MYSAYTINEGIYLIGLSPLKILSSLNTLFVNAEGARIKRHLVKDSEVRGLGNEACRDRANRSI